MPWWRYTCIRKLNCLELLEWFIMFHGLGKRVILIHRLTFNVYSRSECRTTGVTCTGCGFPRSKHSRFKKMPHDKMTKYTSLNICLMTKYSRFNKKYHDKITKYSQFNKMSHDKIFLLQYKYLMTKYSRFNKNLSWQNKKILSIQ